MGTHDEIKSFAEMLKIGHPEERRASAIKLGRIRDRIAVPYLIEAAMTDTHRFTRIAAIQSMTWILDPTCIQTLIKIAMDDDDDEVRKTAIEALAAFKDSSVIEPLHTIVNRESNTEIIKAASVTIQILQEITPKWSSDQ